MSKGDMDVVGAYMDMTICDELHPTHKCMDFDDEGEPCAKPVRYVFSSYEDCASMDDFNFTCLHFCEEHIDILLEDMRIIMEVVANYKAKGETK